MATPPPVTDTIGSLRYGDRIFRRSPNKTRANAKLHILDTLGVALAGVSTPAAEIALDYCKSLGASHEASIWGTRRQGIGFHARRSPTACSRMRSISTIGTRSFTSAIRPAC